MNKNPHRSTKDRSCQINFPSFCAREKAIFILCWYLQKRGGIIRQLVENGIQHSTFWCSRRLQHLSSTGLTISLGFETEQNPGMVSGNAWSVYRRTEGRTGGLGHCKSSSEMAVSCIKWQTTLLRRNAMKFRVNAAYFVALLWVSSYKEKFFCNG